MSPADYQQYTNWNWPRGMPEGGIRDPSETVTFGEKAKDSHQMHMDFYQLNDLEELEHKRHGRGSNFAFADGSVRFLPYWRSLNPINLWAVTDLWRTTPFPPPEPP
jgi:prepilin-type processing-associated H-X9-DG protein